MLDGAIAPQENTRLFGHAEAQAFLAESYASGKGHHALLLEGPEGVGKATLAFRVANHILAHPDPSSAPPALIVVVPAKTAPPNSSSVPPLDTVVLLVTPPDAILSVMPLLTTSLLML